MTSLDDEDWSGDYNPRTKEPRFDPVVPRKSRIAHFDDSGGEDDLHAREKREKTSTWLYGRYNGYSKIVTIKLESEAGMKLLKDIGVTSHSNWPEEPSILKKQNFTDISLDYLQDRKLRERRTIRDADSEEDELALKEALCGHPAARGCVSCARHDLQCSLLSDGMFYPCVNCREEGCDCTFFTQPKLKDGCLNCKKARLVCSYRKSDDKHDVACEKCQSDGKNCLAGPKDGNMRHSPSYDFNHSVAAPPKNADFENNKTHGSKSASERKNRTRGCKNIETRKKSMVNSSRTVKAGGYRPARGKTTAKGKTTATGKTAAKGKLTSQQGSNHPHPNQFLSSVHGTALPDDSSSPLSIESGGIPHGNSPSVVRTGGERWITANFPHPILFNDPPAPNFPCSFCTDSILPMIGYGTVDVIVSYTCPTEPYYQIRGGHKIAGPTFMCSDCTIRRMIIALCKDHDLIDLNTAWIARQAEATDFDKYLDPDCEVPTPFEWCSLCVSPAKVGCCTEHGVGEWGDADVMVGCGLRLCEMCEFEYKVKSGENLDELIEIVQQRFVEGDMPARADAEFLHLRGHMMRRMFATANAGNGT